MPPRVKNPAQPATAPKAKTTRLKVRVKDGFTGYYDHARRREGDVFIIEAKDFSDRWMEKVAANTPESISTAQDAINQAHDEILASRAPASGVDADGL